MSNWPVSVSTGRFGPSSSVSVTSGAAPSYGSWATLDSSIPANVYAVVLHRTTTGTGDRFAINLGIGSAGSEVIIASDLLSAVGSTIHAVNSMILPLKLPQGQRLAIQSTRTSSGTSNLWRVEYITNPFLAPIVGSRIITYGFDVSTMLGTLLTAGSSASFGSSVQVVASTPRRARAMAITGWGVANGTTIHGLVQAVYGASTVPVGPSFPCTANTSTAFMQDVAVPRFLPCDIPAGSDIRLRLWDNNTGAPQRYFQLHLVF